MILRCKSQRVVTDTVKKARRGSEVSLSNSSINLNLTNIINLLIRIALIHSDEILIHIHVCVDPIQSILYNT